MELGYVAYNTTKLQFIVLWLNSEENITETFSQDFVAKI